MQAFANVAAASVIRLGALDCTQALQPLPTPRQRRVAADMVEVLNSLTPLPPELCRYIVELSRGPTLRRVASPHREGSDAPDSNGGECEMGANCCRASTSALGLGLGPGVQLAPPSSLSGPEPQAGPSQRKRRASEAAEGIERATARARTPVASDVSSGRRSPLPMPEPTEAPDAEDEVRQMDEHDHDHMPPIDPGAPRAGGAGIDWAALDAALNRLAVFVPVSPGEMDELVAAQIRDDIEPYAPFTHSPEAMELDHAKAHEKEEEEEEEEELPTRTLADEYDSDDESDIVD